MAQPGYDSTPPKRSRTDTEEPEDDDEEAASDSIMVDPALQGF